MNLADVFTYLFVILGFVIVFIGYWLMTFGLFPRFVERAARRIAEGPIKMMLLGAITLIPLIALGFTISNRAPSAVLKIMGVGLALVALLGALLGTSGLALRIGEGLGSMRDEAEPWRRVLRGGVVLALTFVLPFVGTFIVMPFAFLAGFGALLKARRKGPHASDSIGDLPAPGVKPRANSAPHPEPAEAIHS